MDRASQSLFRLFDVAEVCWEDADTIVYAGRGFEIPEQTLLRAPKAPTPDPVTLERLVRHYTVASRLPRGCTVPPIALTRFGQSQGLLLGDVAGRPVRIEAPGARERLIRSLRVAIAALDPLSLLHGQGLVHGRIAPANLWMAGEDGPVALFDLSAAQGPGLAALAEAGGGHPHQAYMAPELLRGSPGAATPAADLFAMGAILYEWLTGRPPFEEGDRRATPLPPAVFQPLLPPGLSALVLALLSPDPAARPTDHAALRTELECVLEAVRIATAGDGAGRVASNDHGAAEPRLEPRFCGRAPEQEMLFRCLDGAREGQTGLVLITGPPGVGKTALAQRLQERVAAAGGLFAAGKFDQVAGNTPYEALAQALSRLAARILAEPEARFAAWKARLSAALGVNAQVAIDLVPELALILGRQAALQALPPTERRNRFHQVFRDLLHAFAGRGRPLCMLLDDMQWADPATLELLQTFLRDPEPAHVLFVGTCRSAETGVAQPVAAMVEALRRDGRTVAVIQLEGLNAPQVDQLVSDLLERTGPEVGELSALLYRKSAGNPFALEQIVRHLRETRLLVYDRGLGEWCWSMREIWDSDPTEDVVALLREKMGAQPEALRRTLATAACLGAAFDADRLATAQGTAPETVRSHLQGAEELGLIRRAADPQQRRAGATHHFVHDRVQQAALSLIDPADLPGVRLGIARCLLRALPEEKALAAPFEIVSNLNAGADLIEAAEERLLGARLNLAAGRLSRAALAWHDALVYQRAGLALLDASAWQAHYRLAFDLHADAFECEYQTLALERANELFGILVARAASALDRASVCHTKILLDISTERYADAMQLGRQALAELGVRLPRWAGRRHVLLEVLKARILMLRRSPASLEALPDMNDPRAAVAARILLSLSPGAYFVNPNATMLMGLRIVTLSMRAGNSPSSAGGYVLYGLALAAVLGDNGRGQAFGELAVALARRFEDITVRCRTLLIHAGFVAIWRRPFAECLALLREAYATATAAGDLTYANYAVMQTLFIGFARGAPLPEHIEECERVRAFFLRTQDPFAIDNRANWVQSARALQGLTRSPVELGSEEFDEAAAERRYRDGSNLTTLGYYLIRKLHLACLFGETAAAFRFGREAERFFALLPGQVMLAEHALYFGLTLVEMRRTRAAPAIGLRLAQCRRRLRRWAAEAPENYRAMHLLLEAEHATLRGPAARALPVFDQAIDVARAGGFRNLEALAAERAAMACRRDGQSRAAAAYLDEAIAAYRAWGATAKVEQLTGSAGSSGDGAAPPRPGADPGRPAAAAAPTQAMDDTASLDGVLRRLAEDAMASLDSAQVALVLRERGSPVVRAVSEGSSINLVAERLEESGRASPAVVNYVLRSNSMVVLTDFVSDERFAPCPHLRRRRPGSVLCLPIRSGEQPLGALYIEAAPLAGHGTAATDTLSALCTDAGASIERARMGESLRQSRTLLHHTTRAAESATRMRSHLEKFVPTSVQRLIIDNPDAPDLKPVDRDISVMFLDIEGYTALSEQVDRATLSALLERHFSRYLDEIRRFGGDVNQTAGDGLMALFLEPHRHAEQAVRTALAVQRATEELAGTAEGSGLPRIRLHIGINSGTASVGAARIEATGASLWTYTAVGPVVNLASRVANAARGGEILIGSATAERIAGTYRLDAVGAQSFKNVREATQVFRVLGPATES